MAPGTRATILKLMTICWLTNCASASPKPSQAPTPRLMVRAPSRAEEWASLEESLRNYGLLKKNGYTVALPDHPKVTLFKNDPVPMPDEEKRILQHIFEHAIFAPAAYDAAVKTVDVADPRLKEVFKRFDEWQGLWNFGAKSEYTAVITLYGPGGEYYPDRSRVKLLADRAGAFLRNEDPVLSIVHEMVQIGVDRPIVRKLGLTHWDKERLADLMVVRAFGPLFPGFTVTSNGSPELDALVTEEGLRDLARVVESWATAKANAEEAKLPAAARPHIVQFSPPEGARNVRAETTELTVEFDQDMNTEAPVCVDTPCGETGVCYRNMHWRNARILVIATDRPLPPAHKYSLSIGVDQCRMKSRAGGSMLPKLWEFETP